MSLILLSSFHPPHFLFLLKPLLTYFLATLFTLSLLLPLSLFLTDVLRPLIRSPLSNICTPPSLRRPLQAAGQTAQASRNTTTTTHTVVHNLQRKCTIISKEMHVQQGHGSENEAAATAAKLLCLIPLQENHRHPHRRPPHPPVPPTPSMLLISMALFSSHWVMLSPPTSLKLQNPYWSEQLASISDDNMLWSF